MACEEPEGLTKQECAYFRLLEETTMFSISGDQLTMSSDSGDLITFSSAMG